MKEKKKIHIRKISLDEPKQKDQWSICEYAVGDNELCIRINEEHVHLKLNEHDKVEMF